MNYSLPATSRGLSMPDFSQARKNMADCQIRPSGITMPGLAEAFESVPREKFVPDTLKRIAYTDGDMSVGEGRYLLNPTTQARMIQAVQPKASDVVLDIGGATGYSAAVLSSLVTTVIALEEKQKFIKIADKIWQELGICNVASLSAKLTQGSPEHAPFDLIFLNGAITEIPEKLVAQLGEGGRLIAIIKQPGEAIGNVTLVQSLGEKRFSSYTLFEAGAHYLPGFEPLPAFSF